MKLLVEISQGLGNCVQGTPLLHALWLWFVHPETAAPVTVEAPAPF